MGIELQFYKMKRIMGMDGGDDYTTHECIYYHLTVSLKMIKMVNFLCVF